jgi:RHS repeat-associated protein
VVDQRWLIVASGLALDRFQYGYDRDSNRLYRDNLVNSSFGELYHANGPSNGYDQLNQLTNFARGTLNSTKDTITTPSHSQSWTLDALGNWSSVTTDGSTQTRTANQQNEITSILGQTTPGYDANGNMTGDQGGKSLIFDAWNRLVQFKNGSTVLETYSYDGLNRRVTENPGTLRDLYFSSFWQVLEEDVTGSMQDQYVWSPVYVDAMIERDTPTQRLYVQQDANWNVSALIDTSGNVQERYIYDPYGQVTILSPSWSTRGSSSFSWVFLDQGGRLDNATGLYGFRYRDYSPTLGRWIQNDPIGFGGGDSNLYGYLSNDPNSANDPSGLRDRPPLELDRPDKPGKPKPPPGSPGVGMPDPDAPGQTLYYPPQAYKPGNKVAIISDDTCANDRFCWVPKRQHHPGVGSYAALEAALNQYADGSIDVLIISGSRGGQCSCRTKDLNVDLGGPNMPAWVYALIQRKLRKPNGEVIIASCFSGATALNKPNWFFWEHNLPNYVQQTANKCKCPVTGCPGGTFGQYPGTPASGGGSGWAPWQKVPPEK